MFLGAGLATVACWPQRQKTQLSSGIGWPTVTGPVPLETYQIPAQEQIKTFSTYEVQDKLVLPDGFTYDIIAAWGDKLGDSRVGYNNDYLSFIPTSQDEGFLTINFEYISDRTWMETYQQVIGKSLPFAEVIAALKGTKGEVDAYKLKDNNPLKGQIREICQEALEDQGIGVMFLRRNANGVWERVNSPAERRISGLSGLKGRYLKATGPGVAVFEKAKKQGYDDGLGAKITGTFANCAGGTSPWGTVFSAEENYHEHVPEGVYPDGSSAAPEAVKCRIGERAVDGQGNVFGLAGNKYGYMVEVDPANPDDWGTKHTWLGRYRHEAVAFRVVAGKPMAVYSGCDRRGGHLYKFVSQDSVKDPKDKANSRLMASGMLYAAVFQADGTGRWIALKPETPVNPILPSTVFGGVVTLPKRPEGGFFVAKTDGEVKQFQQKYKTLGDLYTGSALEKQGAILIDAHFAANAAGATTTARPEDAEIAADGQLYITFTSGSPDGEGGPDKRVFVGPNGADWEHGWIVRLAEDGGDPAAMTFKWATFAMGGEATDGGAGFSNPDNLFLDQANNVWMVTDISTDKHNNPEDKNRRGCFGNNSIWVIPTAGENAGNAFLFGMGPMECEITGPFLTPDQKTLFLAVQHPGEWYGPRQNGASETREFKMKTTTGEEFIQKRLVPLGSNWPSQEANQPPRPAVVAVRRTNGEPIV